MRMWMVYPKLMCDRHLLGEHVEIHMLAGALAKGKSVEGYLAKGLLAPQCLFKRHWDLVVEMTGRGFKHVAPLRTFAGPAPSGAVNKDASLRELARRCRRCRRRIKAAGMIVPIKGARTA